MAIVIFTKYFIIFLYNMVLIGVIVRWLDGSLCACAYGFLFLFFFFLFIFELNCACVYGTQMSLDIEKEFKFVFACCSTWATKDLNKSR